MYNSHENCCFFSCRRDASVGVGVGAGGKTNVGRFQPRAKQKKGVGASGVKKQRFGRKRFKENTNIVKPPVVFFLLSLFIKMLSHNTILLRRLLTIHIFFVAGGASVGVGVGVGGKSKFISTLGRKKGVGASGVKKQRFGRKNF